MDVYKIVKMLLSKKKKMGKKKTYFPEESHCRRPSSIQLSTFNVLTSLYYALRGRDIVMYQCACVRAC